MVEVNITEQEPEPDIRPSSRQYQQEQPHHQDPQQQQQQLEQQRYEYVERREGSRSISDEHAVRRSPPAASITTNSVTPNLVSPLSSATPTTFTSTAATTTTSTTATNLHHDVSTPDHLASDPRPDALDIPSPPKSNPSAPIKSILQGVTNRFTSYPNNNHKHRRGANGNHDDIVSASSPDLLFRHGPGEKHLAGKDEKDYLTSVDMETVRSTSPPPTLIGAPPAGGTRRYLYKSSSANDNDLHARFSLNKEAPRYPSPLGPRQQHVDANHHVMINVNGGDDGNNGLGNGGSAELGTGGIGLVGPMRPTKSIAELLVPGRKLGSDPTWSESLKNTVKSSFIVYLLPIVPVAWALHFSGQSDVIVFVFSFLAVIPLASLLSFATEQLALRMGDALGGLLNATFGNAVELLISILALAKGEIGLVQASMIGSILSNTLLVLGCCFFAGGLRFHEQIYSTSASQLQISLLGIAMCALVLPAAFQFSLSSLSTVAVTSPVEEITDLSGSQRATLLSISRGVSFMLLSTYAVYLVFQLYTHAYLFKRRPQAIKRPHHEPGEPHPNHAKVLPISEWVAAVRSRGSASSSSDGQLTPMTTRDTTMAATIPGTEGGNSSAVDVELGGTAPSSIRDNRSVLEFSNGIASTDDDEEEEKPLVKALFALCLLLAVTGITGVTAEFLVDSIDGVTESTDISKEFVGLILLPIVGNIPEHVCAVTVSIKDKLDLSLSIAVGSTIQVALGILPLLVLIGWAIGQPMSLFFDSFQIISLAVSLIIVQFAISDGRSCFAEGYILIMTYFIFALCSWYYDPSKIL